MPSCKQGRCPFSVRTLRSQVCYRQEEVARGGGSPALFGARWAKQLPAGPGASQQRPGGTEEVPSNLLPYSELQRAAVPEDCGVLQHGIRGHFSTRASSRLQSSNQKQRAAGWSSRAGTKLGAGKPELRLQVVRSGPEPVTPAHAAALAPHPSPAPAFLCRAGARARLGEGEQGAGHMAAKYIR